MTTFADANATYQRAARARRSPPPPRPPGRRSAAALVADFAAAHLRLVREGRVRRPVADHRLTVCSGVTAGGEHVSAPCPKYDVAQDRCTACGCPDWPVAKMRRKVWYPADICPLRRFSIARGRRARSGC